MSIADDPKAWIDWRTGEPLLRAPAAPGKLECPQTDEEHLELLRDMHCHSFGTTPFGEDLED